MLVAGYQEIDSATGDFESLVARVKDKESYAEHGQPAVRVARPRLVQTIISVAAVGTAASAPKYAPAT